MGRAKETHSTVSRFGMGRRSWSNSENHAVDDFYHYCPIYSFVLKCKPNMDDGDGDHQQVNWEIPNNSTRSANRLSKTPRPLRRFLAMKYQIQHHVRTGELVCKYQQEHKSMGKKLIV